jgi:hypothetical protein
VNSEHVVGSVYAEFAGDARAPVSALRAVPAVALLAEARQYAAGDPEVHHLIAMLAGR